MNLSKIPVPRSAQENEKMRTVPYREAVGSLLYLAVGTRPDISYAVSTVARYCSSPTMEHWKAVKHIFRYLQATESLGLTFKPADHIEFKAFSDASWNREAGHKSISGYLVTLNDTPIEWGSKKQPIIATGTMEAEYIAAYTVTLKIMALQNMMEEVGLETNKPIPLFCDNDPAVNLANNPISNSRSDHIDRQFHKVREQVQAGNVEVNPISGKLQPADIFTKALTKPFFTQLRKNLVN